MTCESEQAGCCAPSMPSADPRYRRILGTALVLNIAMFGVEIAGSVQSGSVSLLADAIAAGIETMHMIKKGRLDRPNAQASTAASQFYSLAF